MARWSDMTKEERSAEMKRRQATAKRNRKKNGKAGRPKMMKEGNRLFCGKCGEDVKDRYAFAQHVRSKHPKRGMRKGGASDDGSAQEVTDHLDHHSAYLFGKVETIIEYYASSNGLPQQALAERVAALLRHPQGR